VVALVKRKYSVTAARRRLRSSMFKYAQLAEDLPREVRNILGMVKQNKLAVNLEHRGLQRLTDTINSASRAVSVALLIAALLVGSSILVLAARGTDGMWLKVLGSAGFLLAAVLSIGMVVRR
jgi:ubiquinone biosynthesis protein